jgi:hypothetical protein
VERYVSVLRYIARYRRPDGRGYDSVVIVREGINPESKFFINRPIVAMVIAILTVIIGAVTIASLPVAQLRREAYLAEAQRLSHTGSFSWNVLTGEIYWSEETYNIFEHDRAVNPTLESALQRIHPDDRDLVQQIIGDASEARPRNYAKWTTHLVPNCANRFWIQELSRQYRTAY